MKLRAVNIGRLLYETMRPNYALANIISDKTIIGQKLSDLYLLALSMLQALAPSLNEFMFDRLKAYRIAQAYGSSQVIWVLNQYYGEFGLIKLKSNDIFIYPQEENIPKYLSDTVPTYFYSTMEKNTINIAIPLALFNSDKYEDFVADLYAMTLYGMIIYINTY